jgi:hypothetical protein
MSWQRSFSSVLDRRVPRRSGCMGKHRRIHFVQAFFFDRANQNIF